MDAATGYDDMWVDPADDPRENAGPVVDERSLLLEYLRTQRLTLSMKCADLDADGFAARSVPPSTMSLLGLVRHMAEVERSWSRRVMAQQHAPRRYATDVDRDGDWTGAVADDVVVHEAWVALREEQSSWTSSSPPCPTSGPPVNWVMDGASRCARFCCI